MRDRESLRLDHERSLERLRALGEIRFRLLAFVPTIAGATLAVLPARAGPSAFVAVGLVGLPATVGVFLYELRNTELVRELNTRVRVLERGGDPDAPDSPGFDEESATPAGPLLFGLVRPTHARGLALIYAAALAAWVYLVVWGALGVVEVPGANVLGGIVALAAGVAIVAAAERFDEALRRRRTVRSS